MTVATSPRTQLALLNDGQLLNRFVARGDQAAFAVLVQRHGPMVLGLCRRLLRHEHDSEDAFQATFVVLARKAVTICKHDSVSSWLYKVAYRIALRQRSDNAKRQSVQARPLPEPPDNSGIGDVVRRELKQVMDEEVHRLPEKYRAPILLCYLQGQTNEQAAALLHCPTGTVKIRLLRGREMLRNRLLKRGLALSGMAFLADVLMNMADAAVPQPLQRLAAQTEAGSSGIATIARLADGCAKGMCLAKLKVAALVLVTLGLTCLADTMLTRASGAAPDAQLEQPYRRPLPTPTCGQRPLIAFNSPF